MTGGASIPSKPEFETDVGERFGLVIERSWDKNELEIVRKMFNDEFCAWIDGDYVLLESLVALKLYKIERGIEE